MSDLSPNGRRLLEALQQGGGDGFELMKRSGNIAAQMVQALYQIPKDMLITKGSLSEADIGVSFIALAPSAKGDADALLH